MVDLISLTWLSLYQLALDDEDIQILRTYGQGPYAKQLKTCETDIKEIQARVNEKMGTSRSLPWLYPLS